ncbi:DNA (cytosine-5-)-methyltransferase [Actinobacillus ureae ATCC 25976]|uniref:site-specific DNA-methyltransferase (adenine-specific) n=1 Tax=Actinobacillus ureae ATCC 25976 TaxID=887324 RepID=E8KH12_9PAST|nr:site-specific DNA-methyltransferase [Actinobacillus ureae]EFX91812.1 DNA (cytosine-5-)-methyltransferase [Actinobacillus ureae ATCC 25976]
MPEIFSEGKIDFDKFQQLFSDKISTEPDRYHLNWAGKSQAYQQLQIPTQKTLTPCVEESVDFEQTQNILIEGENLDVLKALQKSYFNSIKMIYIDPPYNTGNDFVYNDNFAQSQTDYQAQTGEIGEDGFLKKAFRKNAKENGHFHSNWLNMMLPRLHLARNLLKDDGVIFISIDDNEQAQLKLLCGEVFGEENFVANVIWKHTEQNKNDEKYFSRQFNYLLVYKKSNALNKFRFPRTEQDNVNYSNPDNDPKGKWRSGDVRSPNFRKTLCFNITTPSGKIISPPDNGWRWNEESIKEKIATGEIIFIADETKIVRKIYLSEQEGRVPENLWQGELSGTTRISNAEIKDIFENAIFDTPKPTRFLKRIMELFHFDKDYLVLDFFAGSSTTAHAVMQLNAEDNGNRRFICVQLPEETDEKSEAYKAGFKNIAEISKERIRRAGSQILQKNEENRPLDVGFKVFKLTDSHFKQWQSPTAENLAQQLEMFIDNVKENAEPQAMLYEILLRLGLKLTCNVRYENNIFWIEDEKSQHYAILLEHIDENLLNSVINVQPQKVVALDRLFAGNYALKKNAELQMKDANIAFFVI